MKAKIFRVSAYIVDIEEYQQSLPEADCMHNLLFEGWTFNIHQAHVEESEVIDVTDNDPIMKDNCDMAHLEKHFKRADKSDLAKDVVIGGTYKHFKEGKLVKVIAISRHSERPNEVTVVYECKNGVFNRPIEMFLSDVDREKYPDAVQQKRFELVDEVSERC